MSVTVAVLKETADNESRVALVPEVARKLAARGMSIIIESGAGDAALIPDSSFADVEVSSDRKSILARADIVLCVQAPEASVMESMKPGASVIGFLAPHQNLPMVKAMQAHKVTSYGIELIPRISRAQSMDGLSSQAAVAGYKSALIGASELGQFLPMLTTAAGTIRPAKALVIGAGVAGLQAIATLRRLGAITEGYDVRQETKEQVESLGARFLELSVSASGDGGYARELTEDEKKQQADALGEHLSTLNMVITTAAIPGRPAPKIISAEMVKKMKPGSVIVDMAADSGGNCELSEAGKTVIHNGVKVVGPENVPSMLPVHASEMYAKNLMNFLGLLMPETEVVHDFEDEILAGSVLTFEGEIRHETTKKAMAGES